MEKEKILLKDNTEIEIENGAIENCIQIICDDFNDIKTKYEKFTESNLEEYKILNANGLTCAIFENKYVKSILIEPIELGFRVSFNLNDVDMVVKRLARLEESQDIQDGAIGDLGTMVSDLASGGE